LIQQKDAFLSATTHELRTPLNAIIGLSRGMLNGCTGTLHNKTEKFLTLINHSGMRLLNLVNDILDSANMRESKQLQISKVF
jgi:signal transduction histidine kinase